MLPALPTGSARMSGALPRSSQISKAAVVWPSIRYGLRWLTRVTGRSFCSAISRTTRSASSKLPSTAMTLAPATIAWISLPSAILPLGRTTITSSPATAPYAAAEAEVFPAEAQITACAPSSTALEMAMTMPRSLNEPVGFVPSYFTYRFGTPMRLAMWSIRPSGVKPSPRVMIGVASVTGRNSRSRSTRRGRAGYRATIGPLAGDVDTLGLRLRGQDRVDGHVAIVGDERRDSLADFGQGHGPRLNRDPGPAAVTWHARGRRDGHFLGETAGDLVRENARQADVPRPAPRGAIIGQGDELRGRGRQVRPRGEAASDDFEQVRQHGAAGGRASGTGPLKADPTDRIGIDLEAVENAIGSAERGPNRHGRGHDGTGQAEVGLSGAWCAGCGNEANGEAQSHGTGDVGGRNARDTGLAVAAQGRRAGNDRVDLRPRPKGEAGQDGQLVGSVMAFDIGAGIALGVALGLGRREDFFVGPLGLHHLGQDEVGAAVDDAPHPADMVGGQAAGDRVQDGGSAADGRLKSQCHGLRPGDHFQLEARVREDRLVGGDDGLARVQGIGDEGPGRLVATQQFHNHVDVVAADHGRGVAQDQVAGQATVYRSLHVHVGDGDEFQHPATRGANLPVRTAEEAAGYLSADGAHAEDRDTYGSLLGGHGLVVLGPAGPTWHRSQR